MKLEVLQEDLAKAVGIAARFTNSKAQLPVLGNILLSAKKTKIIVSSTNLEMAASIAIGAKVEEEGEITVPARIFSELILNLPKEPIDLVSEKEQLKVSTSGFSSLVLGMSSADFPNIPSVMNKEKSLSLPGQEVLRALSQVSYSTSQDETRPILTGVLLLCEKEKISFVATDGFRLSRKFIKISGSSTFKLVLPKSIMSEISREGGENVLFDFDQKEKQAIFQTNETILTSRLLEGEYPDYEKIIPKESSVNIRVDKDDFQRAVKLASVFARDSANIVKIKILENSLKILAESGNTGTGETDIEAKIEKTDSANSGFEISFNFRFLEDFINSVVGDEIVIGLTGSSSAGVFKDPSDSSYLHLIMPVRIQN